MKIIKWGITAFFVIGIVYGGIGAYALSTTKDTFFLSTCFVFLGLALTLNIYANQVILSRFQQFNGYTPSKRLDEAVHFEYMRRRTETKKVHGLNPFSRRRYSSKKKHTDILLHFMNESVCECSQSIANGSYTCIYTYSGVDYTVTAATYELAMSIAFLKSAGYTNL